jgi:hypothetical protein
MEGSPSLLRRTPTLIKASTNPFERDVYKEQSAKISAMFHDKTEKSAPKATVGENDSLRARILAISLFPNIYNKKFVERNSG